VSSSRTLFGASARAWRRNSTPVISGMRWSLTMTRKAILPQAFERGGTAVRRDHFVRAFKQPGKRIQHPLLVVHE